MLYWFLFEVCEGFKLAVFLFSGAVFMGIAIERVSKFIPAICALWRAHESGL